MGNPNQPRDSRGRWTKGAGATTVATVAALGMMSAGGGAGAGGGAASVESAAGQSVRSNMAKSKNSAKKGKQDDAWRDMGLKRVKQVAKQAVICAVNSYGDVRRFFEQTPCRSLDRMLFALGDGQGSTVVVSVAWVTMPSAGSAEQLRTLADTDGTGNVSPLAGALVDAAGIRFTGHHYDSRRGGKLVVIAEAEPLSGTPGADFLNGVAEVAVEFPPP
jgi:hypothetical protein